MVFIYVCPPFPVSIVSFFMLGDCLFLIHLLPEILSHSMKSSGPVWHIKNAGVFSSLYRESISPLCPLSSNFNFSQNFLGRLLDRDIYIWIT